MSVRSHAKGCFIELDTLHEDGVNWETNYRWNYAVQVCTRIAALFPLVLALECFYVRTEMQENVQRHGFTFPEVNVLLLLDLVDQLINEHILLDLEVKDFADLQYNIKIY